MEQHFPEFPEKGTTSRDIPKFSYVTEISVLLDSPSKFCSSEIQQFSYFLESSQGISVTFVPVSKFPECHKLDCFAQLTVCDSKVSTAV